MIEIYIVLGEESKVNIALRPHLVESLGCGWVFSLFRESKTILFTEVRIWEATFSFSRKRNELALEQRHKRPQEE